MEKNVNYREEQEQKEEGARKIRGVYIYVCTMLLSERVMICVYTRVYRHPE